MDDKILFERITHNDEAAFGIVMDRYAAALFSFAFRILDDEATAEDIVQEVFMNLWVRRRVLNPGPSLRNFLYLSVRNLALNHRRMKKRHMSHAESYRLEQAMSLFVVDEERYRLFVDAMGRLAPRAAEVISLSLEGVRQEEIGRRMGITVATVKALKADGLKKLRKLLSAKTILK